MGRRAEPRLELVGLDLENIEKGFLGLGAIGALALALGIPRLLPPGSSNPPAGPGADAPA